MAIRVSGTHFTDHCGTPFFWLADTAWNAALRGDNSDWREYLAARARQGFSVVQFVATQWRGCRNPIRGPVYEVAGGKLKPKEDAFASLDQWIDMINAHGMVAAPVMLWANTPRCPGQHLLEKHCIELGRHMVQRWRGRDVVWLLAGDGSYTPVETAARWKRIGAGIFADHPGAAVTMHPCGCSWVGDVFDDQGWYSFVGIQSGHGNAESDLKFLLAGAFAKAWTRIRRPFVNLEPNYEDAKPYGTQDRFTDYHVRRAAYWSLLSAPTAGVTYGNNSIWVWGQQAGELAEEHDDTWVAYPWREGLQTAGVKSMTVMKGLFEALPWTGLRPAQQLLAHQPGRADLTRYVAIATTDGRECTVAYIPCGDELCIRGDIAPTSARLHWIDPRTSDRLDRQESVPAGAEWCAKPPDGQDWLAVIAAVD